MRWVNHQTSGFFLTYAATGDFLASFLVSSASIFPDAIELPFGNLVKHRGLSHWPYPYFILAFCLLGGGVFSRNLFLYYLGMPVIGCLIHLGEDLLSPGGIPLKHPMGPRKGLNLYVPFTAKENGIALSIIFVAVVIAWLQGFLTFSYIVLETKRSYRVLIYLSFSLFG